MPKKETAGSVLAGILKRKEKPQKSEMKKFLQLSSKQLEGAKVKARFVRRKSKKKIPTRSAEDSALLHRIGSRCQG